MQKYLVNIILIIIWMFVIFSFSGQNGESSGSFSNTIIIKIANIISKEEITPLKEEELIKKYSFIVRKSGHFGLYFILAFLVFLLVNKIYNITPKTFIYTVIFCFVYACSDELHQSFISGRACSFMDVIIDTFGSLVSTTILYIFGYFKNRSMIKK